MGINVQKENITLSNSDVRKMMWLIFATATLVTILVLILGTDFSSGNLLASLNFEILLIPLVPIFTGAYLILVKEKKIELNQLGISFSSLHGENDILISWKEILAFHPNEKQIKFSVSRFEEEIFIIPGDYVMTSDNEKINKLTTTITEFVEASLDKIK
jgi:hypothetical protein